jgi:hypothetical protein
LGQFSLPENANTANSRSHACLNYPVPQHGKRELQAATVSDGRHTHAFGLSPPRSRLKEGWATTSREAPSLYAPHGLPLSWIEAKRIKTNPAYVVEYALKALRRGRVDFDQNIVLPRSRAELPAKGAPFRRKLAG